MECSKHDRQCCCGSKADWSASGQAAVGSMNAKKPLYQIPVASTGFIHEATMTEPGPTIRFDFFRDCVAYRSGIRFLGTVATRTRAERACTEWHIQDAYDTLVEIENSPWVAEIRQCIPEAWQNQWQLRHFMIYLDSSGCFEVIADRWEPMAEEPGTWT